VSADDVDRGSLLLVRVWFEPGPPRAFRARVLTSTNLATGRHETVVVASQQELLASVARWLEGLDQREGPPT